MDLWFSMMIILLKPRVLLGFPINPKIMEIMDFSMILVQELFEYGLLGFPLNINLIPISRVLLGKHSNSRFKGSLVEKP